MRAIQKLSPVVMAVPLLMSFSVCAQQPVATPAPGAANAPQNSDAMLDEHILRQDLREEMQKIRAEHEELETEHDQLRTQCLNAKGQERSECQAKFQALAQKRDALHERMKVLHDKFAATHPGHGTQHASSGSGDNMLMPMSGGSPAPGQ